MRAVITQPGSMEITTVDDPAPRPREIVVEVSARVADEDVRVDDAGGEEIGGAFEAVQHGHGAGDASR